MISNPSFSEEELKDGQILLNGEILVKGTFTCDIISTLKDTKIGLKHQDIYIRGTLHTKYYMKEINEIESSRYYINEVFVTKESYDSTTNMICYEFEAAFFQPKFQDTDYERIGKE